MSIRSWRLRSILGLALPLGLFVLAVALAWSRLPAQVVTHWDASGRPDGSTSPGVAVAMAVAIVGGLWAVLSAVAVTAPASALGRRGLLALPGAAGWGLSTLFGGLIAGQGLQSAPPAGWIAAGSLALAVAAGLVGARLTPSAELARSNAPAPPQARRLDEPGRVVWSGLTSTGSGLVLGCVGLVALTLVLAIATSTWLLTAGALVAVMVWATTRFRVLIGPAGVLARGPIGGWPRLSVDLDTITSADVTEADALPWGGWGLRVTSRGSAIITRSGGEALQLDRTDGSVTVITVDDAVLAASVVNTLLDERGGC